MQKTFHSDCTCRSFKQGKMFSEIFLLSMLTATLDIQLQALKKKDLSFTTMLMMLNKNSKKRRKSHEKVFSFRVESDLE